MLLFTALLWLPALILTEPTEPQTDPELAKYAQTLDDLYRGASTQGSMEMTIKNKYYERTLKIDMWTLGLNHTLVRLRSPRKERGNGTLKRGNEMWNYLRKIDKLVRIPPSMMMSSWMGGDFTNDDIVRDASWSADYHAEAGAKHADGTLIIYRPREDAAVTWSRVEVVFSTENGLPLHQSFYDEKDEKVRVLTYSEVQEVGGRLIPTVLTMTPVAKKDQFTRIQYTDLKFDVDLKETFFTTSELRKGI